MQDELQRVAVVPTGGCALLAVLSEKSHRIRGLPLIPTSFMLRPSNHNPALGETASRINVLRPVQNGDRWTIRGVKVATCRFTWPIFA